jgi:flagellar biosynthesis protein FlhF
MGPDAFILSRKEIQKKGPLGFGNLKFWQVTAAIEEEDLPTPRLKEKQPEPTRIDIREDSQPILPKPRAPKAEDVLPKAPTYTPSGKPQETSQKLLEELDAANRETPRFTRGFEAVFAEARQPLPAVKQETRSETRERENRGLRQDLDELKDMVKGIGDRKPSDISPLQKELKELKGLLYNVIRNQTPIFGKSLTTAFISYYQRLKDSGIDENVVAKLIQIADERMERDDKEDPEKVRRYLRNLIAQSVEVGGTELKTASKTRVVALVGPTGVGKTTTLAKLAAYSAIQDRSGVAFITLDTYRIAAVEQLKTYAKIMELPVHPALNIEDMRQAIQFHQDKALILIDTAGHSPHDETRMSKLKELLEAQEDIEVHLVLSATTKPADLNDAVNKFKPLDPKYLLFSKMDETSSFGPLFTQIVKTQKPVSYVTTGQNVPEDFEFASREMLADLFIGKRLNKVLGGVR